MIKSDLIYSTTKTHPNVTITLPADVPEPSMTLMNLVVITKVVVISIPNFILIIHDLKLVFLDDTFFIYIVMVRVLQLNFCHDYTLTIYNKKCDVIATTHPICHAKLTVTHGMLFVVTKPGCSGRIPDVCNMFNEL